MKKVLKKIGIGLLALVLLISCYVAYVFIAYERIPDMQELAVKSFDADGQEIQSTEVKTVPAGEEQSILTWNIGFGAYTADYDFFMDGGTQSWATSKEILDENMTSIAGVIEDEASGFVFLQEVDTDSTRTYHLDERDYIYRARPGCQSVFAQNYNSPFLFYPLLEPHGASRSGILTLTDYSISSSLRRSLPIDESVSKVIDLDRCYSVSRVPVDNGKELCLFNLHLSAYTTDASIVNGQLTMLISDMQAEYENGNYVIAAGDFNKDLTGENEKYFGISTEGYDWARTLPEGVFDDTGLSLIVPLDEENPVPSCRNPDSAYHEGQFVVTVDGFAVSDNVEVKTAEVLDLGFAYSDHNPARMTFVLK